MSDLKLLALDAEDLNVISAHVQDAVLRVQDMGLAEQDHRFALIISRFVWENAEQNQRANERRRAALRFDRVTAARVSGIDLNAREGVLEVLSVGFTPTDAPAGKVSIVFAGGGTVELDVECLEGRLHDLGAAWAAKARPVHDLSDAK